MIDALVNTLKEPSNADIVVKVADYRGEPRYFSDVCLTSAQADRWRGFWIRHFGEYRAGGYGYEVAFTDLQQELRTWIASLKATPPRRKRLTVEDRLSDIERGKADYLNRVPYYQPPADLYNEGAAGRWRVGWRTACPVAWRETQHSITVTQCPADIDPVLFLCDWVYGSMPAKEVYVLVPIGTGAVKRD